MAEPAAEQFSVLQRIDQSGDALVATGKRAIDPFGGEQHAALQIERGAQCKQRFPQGAEVGQCGKLIEGSDPVSSDSVSHGPWFIRGSAKGKPRRSHSHPDIRRDVVASHAAGAIAQGCPNMSSSPRLFCVPPAFFVRAGMQQKQ